VGSQNDGQAGSRTLGREASSREFHRAAKSNWLESVEVSAPYELKEEMFKSQLGEGGMVLNR
jgi:hypothetical protein